MLDIKIVRTQLKLECKVLNNSNDYYLKRTKKEDEKFPFFLNSNLIGNFVHVLVYFNPIWIMIYMIVWENIFNFKN